MTAAVRTVRLGFIPLMDCAALVVAHEMGFAEREGLTLDLRKEASWAAIRDKVLFGLYDGAHMLAGIPLAGYLGLGGVKAEMIIPMALGYGGNAVTLSTALYERMVAVAPEIMAGPPARRAEALGRVIAEDKAQGRPPYSLATVFPFSNHNYELRYWLAAAGIDPDRDVNMATIAPPRMAESLTAGWVDGYCVGEPWNTRAQADGVGRIVVTKQDIWPAGPEKVLGLGAAWAAAQPDTARRLLVALVAAARWADEPANRPALAEMLGRPEYVHADAGQIQSVLEEDRFTYFARGATYPWRAHGTWLLSQMVRWGQITHPADLVGVAEAVCRSDLYRDALGGQLDLPAEEPQIVGRNDRPFAVPGLSGAPFAMAPDRFFDGRPFDRQDPVAYAFGFPIGHPALSPEAFAAAVAAS